MKTIKNLAFFVALIYCSQCSCALQEELRPEYEEALQEKKDKLKAQMKKKVCEYFQFKRPDLRRADCDGAAFTLRVYVLFQLDQAVDGVSGETDQMLSSQVTRHRCL